MQYIKTSVEQFAQYVKKNNKKVIIFGAGAVCKTFLPYIITKYELSKNVLWIIDNNPNKQGSYVSFGKNEVPIRSIESLYHCDEDYCVIISNGEFYSVMKQLDDIEFCDNKTGFIAAMMQLDRQYDRSVNRVYKDFAVPQIPQIIHYCWFSGNPMPEILRECIATWKIHCPDYEFICWNETNYDVGKYRYTKEAYDMQKWGYIPDIVRLDVLYEMGGFYFDTDVKILKNLDELRYQEAFCGRERAGHVNFGGGSGCVPHSRVVKELLDFRSNETFKLKNGSFNAEASGYYETFPLMKKGLQIEDMNQQLEGINIYASEFFSPYNYINGEDIRNQNTYSIHFFSGSWLADGEKLRKETRENYAAICAQLGEIEK